MSQNVELLKTKLLKSTTALKALEHSHADQFNTLTQFIVRLSNLCKGIDLELDNKLAKFRKKLAKAPDLSQVEDLLADINNLMKQHTVRVSQNMKATQTSLLNAGKTLQKNKALPDDLKGDLKSLLDDVNHEQESLLDYIPQLDKLAELYRLSNELSNNKNHKTSTLNSKDEGATACQTEISHELLNVLSNIAFSGENSQRIEKIRLTLSKPVQADELVECCVSIIRLIIGSITEERQSAQSFLVSLNDALSTVHDAVSDSISGSKQISESKSQINAKLDQSLRDIGKDVDEATDLEALKQQIGERLKNIGQSLKAKDQLEKEEQNLLISSLSKMESRLTELEQEAVDYKKKLSEQRFKSLQDSLTKLPNRAAFDERLELEFKRWHRYKHNLCLAVADIDFFKKVNDTYGHSAGDRTLQVVAIALKKSLRETDFIARYGGEEFVIMFPEATLEEIEIKLNHIREQIKRIPFKFKDKNLHISISMGLAKFSDNMQPLEVFDLADEALYKAKRSGRDKVVVASQK